MEFTLKVTLLDSGYLRYPFFTILLKLDSILNSAPFDSSGRTSQASLYYLVFL
jgi:hypothetical protein